MGEIRPSNSRSRLKWAMVVGVALLLLLLLSPLWPISVLDKADLVGYAICHRLGERSFHLAGRQLPLCARCTGVYLGVLGGLIGLIVSGRWRSGLLPKVKVLVVLVIFILAYAVDGVNSYLTLFPGAPHLYQPNNFLRLLTGSLHGLALIMLVFPVFSFTLWRETQKQEVMGGWKELIAFVSWVLLLDLLVLAQFDWLLYPLAIFNALGVLVMFTMVNSIMVIMLAGWEGKASGWREALLPLSLGFLVTLVEIGGIDLFRSWLASIFGPPF